MMRYGLCRGWLTLCALLLSLSTWAATVTDINVLNNAHDATVILSVEGQPVYQVQTRQQPASLILDIRQQGILRGLPLNFSGKNLIKRVRAEKAPKPGTLRLVFDLVKPVRVQTATRHNAQHYVLTLSLNSTALPAAAPATKASPRTAHVAPSPAGKPAKNTSSSGKKGVFRPDTAAGTTSRASASNVGKPAKQQKIVIAVDAGHGGQDPGAIGAGQTQEKTVTLAIARQLQQKLNADPLFHAVLTRTGNYFISVKGRSEVARRQHANLLVSIHADSAPVRTASGASVWVLSNRRAQSEMANWLEQHEKQSELLGGAGDVLASASTDRYLSQAVLDLQFGHSQRVGYDVAVSVLEQLGRVGALHKAQPEHASLGVLRSPDIPSLLVETGFISNPREENMLRSPEYQAQIAQAIYLGLRRYFLANPLQTAPPDKKN